MKKIFVLIFIIIAIIAIAVYPIPQIRRSLAASKINSVEPPIILVHGFNQNANFWNYIHLTQDLEKSNIISMGTFHAPENLQLEIKDTQTISQGQSALYTLSIPEKGAIDIRDSAKLLASTIQKVTKRHKCDKVRLISFSAGGVIAREYLTNNFNNHHVASLTTISSPHMGSEHAWIAVSYQDLKSKLSALQSDTSGNILVKQTKKATAFTLTKLINQLKQWSNQVRIDIDSQCAYMLAEPENDNYLDRLNQANHPSDIQYHCIITEENIINYNWQKLKQDFYTIKEGNFSSSNMATNLLDLARNCLGNVDNSKVTPSVKTFRGDGVVSIFSQNLNNISAFQNNSSLSASITHLDTNHGSPDIKSAIVDSLQLE